MSSKPIIELPLDPKEAVQKAHLHYVDNREAGYRRKKWGHGFTYLDENGNHIRALEQRKRFEDLAIPPAWTEVWICSNPCGHIQVTGRDDDGRKQYIYHPRWQEVRQETKFKKLSHFARALPGLRAQVDKDLRRHHFPRAKVVALVIRLLDETLIRVGNSEYAENYDSYGLTTMHHEHVSVNGSSARFEFTGKGGKEHKVMVLDRRLARHLRKCQQLPGHKLFQFENGEGDLQSVTSSDVNGYLAKYMHEALSAKDFRTWGATVLAAKSLVDQSDKAEDSPIKAQIAEAVNEVAEALGNTPTICRDYYIHPAVITAYEEGRLQKVWDKERVSEEGLTQDEARVLRLLQEHAGS
jgi:DNA topoisomerase I